MGETYGLMIQNRACSLWINLCDGGRSCAFKICVQYISRCMDEVDGKGRTLSCSSVIALVVSTLSSSVNSNTSPAPYGNKLYPHSRISPNSLVDQRENSPQIDRPTSADQNPVSSPASSSSSCAPHQGSTRPPSPSPPAPLPSSPPTSRAVPPPSVLQRLSIGGKRFLLRRVGSCHQISESGRSRREVWRHRSVAERNPLWTIFERSGGRGLLDVVAEAVR